MKLKIEMSLDNAAFQNEDDGINGFAVFDAVETAMRNYIRQYDLVPNRGAPIYDQNGNKVGFIQVEDDA